MLDNGYSELPIVGHRGGRSYRSDREADHVGKTYAITGPAAITHAEIARALNEAIGREITFGDVAACSLRACAARIRRAGMRPEAFAQWIATKNIDVPRLGGAKI